MGYCISMHCADFAIATENKEAALQALKDMAKGVDRFHWASPERILQAGSLSQAMIEWDYELELEGGDVVGIEFINEKLGDEDKMFKAIAPFVKEGSYIEMVGEDGYRWRWCFTGGKMTEASPTLTWD